MNPQRIPEPSALPPLIFDIETDGLLPTMTKIHCGVIYNSLLDITHRFEPEDIPDMVDMLQRTEQPLCGHNIINFDIPAIQKLYPKFQPKVLPIDTKIWSQLVTPDLMNLAYTRRRQWLRQVPSDLLDSHSLKAWGYRIGILKGSSPDETFKEYSPGMLDYCARDVEVTTALRKELLEWTTSEQAVNLEMSEALIIRQQEVNGINFDIKKAELLAAKILDDQQILLTKIREHPTFTPVLKKSFIAKVNNTKLNRKKGDLIEIYEDFNPSSNQQLIDKLMSTYGWQPEVLTDKGNPQMDDEILKDLAETYPEVQLIRDYKTAAKILSYLSTGDKSWIKFVTPEGKLHGQVQSCGAGTRRMTHNSPNLGQVPNVKAYLGKECRELFLPPKGMVMLGIDADQLELRTLAHYMAPFDGGAYVHAAIHGSKENKDDIHWLNAKTFGVDRDTGKTVFYCSIYGGGREKKGRIITKSWDKQKNMVAGAKIERAMDRGLPALGKLRDCLKVVLKTRGYLLDLDKQMFRIRSEHSALNELNQRAGAIIMKRWDVILWNKLVDSEVPFVRLLTVHDEIQIAVPEDYVQKVLKLSREAFKAVTAYYKLRCPITGDGKKGANWSETH